MTERERQRWLHVKNRLEELRAKHGDPELPEPEPVEDRDPSWGPVGSLAKRLMAPEEYEHLLMLHEDMLALERSRRAPEANRPPDAAELPAEPSEQAPRQNRPVARPRRREVWER